jgi:hypothetical protein
LVFSFRGKNGQIPMGQKLVLGIRSSFVYLGILFLGKLLPVSPFHSHFDLALLFIFNFIDRPWWSSQTKQKKIIIIKFNWRINLNYRLNKIILVDLG